MFEQKLGKRIQKCRKKKGLTQEQLAERVALSRNYLSAVERGVNAVSLEKLIEIINCLDCSADEIFMDVINKGYAVKATMLTEKIEQLPRDEQERIFEIIETLLNLGVKLC